MTALVKVWDHKGEPFEVPAPRAEALIKAGWSNSQPVKVERSFDYSQVKRRQRGKVSDE